MKLADVKKAVGKRTLAFMLTALIALLTIGTVSGYNFGYNLYIDEVYVGSFTSEAEAKSVITLINEKDGIDISGNEKVEFGIMDDEKFTDVYTACDNYKKQDERFAKAYSLYIGDERIFSLTSLEEAVNVKHDYISRFREEGAVSVDFTEQSVVAQEYVIKDNILTKEDALTLLESKAEVKTVVKLSYYEAIPYETITVEDGTLYCDETKVENEGLTGEKYVEHTTEKINGEVVSESITGEYIKTEVKARIIRKGTKPYPKGVATGNFTNPSSGHLTSPFGPRWGRMHKGIDIGAPSGTPICASDGGVVIYSGWMSGYGYLVQIDHKNGYTTYYAHCSKLHVKVGDEVARGELISDMGSTGNSTGPHLHFEIRLNNEPQNPENYVKYR